MNYREPLSTTEVENAVSSLPHPQEFIAAMHKIRVLMKNKVLYDNPFPRMTEPEAIRFTMERMDRVPEMTAALKDLEDLQNKYGLVRLSDTQMRALYEISQFYDRKD